MLERGCMVGGGEWRWQMGGGGGESGGVSSGWEGADGLRDVPVNLCEAMGCLGEGRGFLGMFETA